MKKLAWTIKVEVSEEWIKDGFNLRNAESEIRDLFSNMLPHSTPDEIEIKILRYPSYAKIDELTKDNFSA